MNLYPTKVKRSFLVSVLLFLILILSCSKDSDFLKETVLDPNVKPISKDQTDSKEEAEEIEDEETEDEENDEELIEEANKVPTEIRTTVFAPVQDSYLQDGKGYNNELIRLEENHRDSYLMFDLSQIDSIGGTLEDTQLEFTITTDDGSGTIFVYKAEATSWAEDNLTDATAPKIDSLLAETTNDYRVGQTKEIDLGKNHLNKGPVTLVLKHENGDDLAFASKENPTQQGPRLVVVYKAPQDAELITGEELDNTNDDNTPEEETPDEETPDEEKTDEEKTDVDNEDAVALEENEIDTEPAGPETNENQAPKAIIDASPLQGTAPLKVNFSAGKSTDDIEIVSYNWNFTEGNSNKDKNTSHIFEKAGEYEVSLKVTDEQGKSHTVSTIIKVSQEEVKNEAPISKISANKVEGQIPLQIKFNGVNSSDDKKIAAYSWDFKDGNKATTISPNHTFSKEGSYEVSLTVTDEEGLKSTSSLTITASEAKNQAPTAVISGGPYEGYAPLKVEFKAWNSKDDKEVSAYLWDFKDGSTTTTKNPNHTFNSPGSFDVELMVKDKEGLSHTVKQIVTVKEVPTDNGNNGSSGGGSSGGSDNNGGSSSSGGSNSNNYPGGFSELKAFPNAEGFGKNATGGRGGIVVEVTNLNDSGPGSLRYALEEIRVPRTIVFKVGGTINAKSNLPIYAGRGNVTIAGQTAPGGGILIKNGSLSIQADNVIVRHLRFRMNSSANPQGGHNKDGIRVRSSNSSVKIKNIIIDHCSVSWALDENLSTKYAENVTIQNCIIGESTRAMLIAGSRNVSVLNNLFVLNSSRSVLANTVNHTNLTFEQINNIVYGFNWATSGTNGMAFNVISNKYKLSRDFQGSTKYAITLTPPDPANGDSGDIKTTHAYLKNNIIDPGLTGEFRNELKPYLFSYPKSQSGYQSTSANQLDNKLLNHIGASSPKRDAVDTRLINHYKSASGSLRGNGSFPTINNGSSYKDNDKDGIDDDWERANGLNPSDSKDGNKDQNGDGYTNLEDFLYYLTN